MQEYFKLGKEIYNNNRWSDCRRIIVFMIRVLLNHGDMEMLKAFFSASLLRKQIVAANPFIFEQVTRCIFYRGATFAERLFLIQEHFLFLEKKFKAAALTEIYLGNGITLWDSEFHGKTMSLKLNFEAGQKKEGLLAINLEIGCKQIYQLIFWIAPNQDGQMAIWIGALQGSQGGLEIARGLTKHFLGYRPKNMVMRVLRILAAQMGISNIYAISNYGFYANNHIRMDRKLKTSLDEFWQETGGEGCADSRFYTLPIVEARKTIEEVPSKKRNLYRKRFAFIDEIDQIVNNNLRIHLENIGD